MTTGFWQPVPLGTLAGQVDFIELKVVVPEREGRTLGIDSRPGTARRVYFLDTADLAYYRHGVIIRFRDRHRRADDAVVKLRPVRPGRVPGWLRAADRFRMEIDALPGHAVCSGALKERLGRNEVARALAAGRPLTGLLSARQRRLLAAYGPPGAEPADLAVVGPVDVRCHTVRLRGLDRALTAERWRYPDGSSLLELSTRCPLDDAATVAARVSTALRATGIAPTTVQSTKTDLALLA